MSDGPANSETRDDGAREYVHPLTGERFISVTTALQAVSKFALIHWAANLSASAAIAELPKLVASLRHPLCGRAKDDDRCGVCRDCVTRWLAWRHYAESEAGKRRGTAVHKVVEWWANHGEHIAVEPGYEPWANAFRAFVVRYQPRPFLSEATVLNREHSYAGTLDLGLTIRADASAAAAEFCARVKPGADAVDLLVDGKTSRRADNDFYPEWAMQLTGYRRGQVIMHADGTERPLPTVDGCAVLLLRADGEFALRPVVTDDRTFDAFLHTLGLYRWMVDGAAASTQVKSFPLPDGVKATNTRTPKPAATNRRAAPRPATAPRNARTRVSATQGATLASLVGAKTPHPDSPHGDDIPF